MDRKCILARLPFFNFIPSPQRLSQSLSMRHTGVVNERREREKKKKRERESTPSILRLLAHRNAQLRIRLHLLSLFTRFSQCSKRQRGVIDDEQLTTSVAKEMRCGERGRMRPEERGKKNYDVNGSHGLRNLAPCLYACTVPHSDVEILPRLFFYCNFSTIGLNLPVSTIALIRVVMDRPGPMHHAGLGLVSGDCTVRRTGGRFVL